ncbi:MAG: gliding motility-associated C-terminal domain-containing protein [Cytophagaceae bacterium]
MKNILLLFVLIVGSSIPVWSQCNSCSQTFTADATITPSANNQVICITGGTNFSFTSTFSNVTVKICAPGVTISTFRVMTGALNNKVEVYSENVLFSNLLVDADTFKLSTFSTNTQIQQASLNRKTVFTAKSQSSLSILSAITPGDRIFINADQGATINTKGISSNNGGIISIAKEAVINVDGTLHLQNYGTLINYNKLNVTGDLYIQGDSQNAIVNRCGESEVNISGQLFINQGLFYNAGVVIADRITINSNAGPVYPNNGAVLEARLFLTTNNTANIIRADSLDAGACAMFKTPDYSAWNAPLTNSSQINYCGRAATVAQLGSATVSCTCPTARQVCVPVCVAPTSVSISAPFQQACQGTSIVLTGNVFGLNPTHTYTYKWYINSVTPANLLSNPSNASTMSVSSTGSYYLVVSDNANPTLCSTTSAPFVFTVNPVPPQPTIGASGPLNFCDGGSVSLTATVTGFTGGTYAWSNGVNTNPISVSSSGSYTVIYTSAANCTAPVSAATTVTVNPVPPQPTVAASGPLTFCDGGSVSLTASVTGFSGGIYTWSTGSTSNPLSVTTSGSYSVTYVSAANCTTPTSAATTVTVNPIPPQPTVGASGPLTFCDGGSVSLTASVTGFTGGTYTWSTGSTTNPLSVTTSGSYSVTYVSVSNCTAPTSASTTVTVNPIPPQPTVAASGPLTFCDGGSVSLTATVTGFTGGTYAWSNGAITNPISVSTSGSYTVIYTSAANCTAPISASTTVTVNPIPPQPMVVASGPLTFCDGGSVSLTASVTGFTGGTYTWSTGSTTNPLSVTTSGSYSVTYVSVSNCTAPTSASTTVTVNPIPPQPTVAASGPLTFCDGGSVSLTATVTGFTGGTYAWSNGAITNPISVSTSGSYTVIYTSAANCTAPISASTTVTVNPIPPQPMVVASGPLTFCDGGSVSLTASVTGFTGGTYTWSTGSTTNPLSVTTSGSYSVTYVSVSNCTAPTSASTTVTVNPIPPQPTVAASGPLTFCDGGSVSLTATVTGFTGGTYAWSNGAITNPISVSTSGSYTVIYTSAANCTAPISASTTVTVNPIPPQPMVVASGPLTFCDGGSVSLTASVTGFTGGTYTWSTGSHSNPLSVTTSGSYSVTYVSAANCTAPTSAATTVTVNPIPPQPTVGASGPLTFCDGGSVDLTATVTGFTGGTYAWSNGAGTNPITVATSGFYSVIYTSSENCTAPTSAATTVTVNPIPPQPTVGASGPLTFCDGGSVNLTASVSGFSGGVYTWSTGSHSNPLSVTTSGSYSVTYVSAANCTAPTSAATTVTVNPIPPKPTVVANGPLTFCDGGSVDLTATVTGFTGGTYAWSNGAGANPITVATSGSYSVIYTSSENCTAPTSATTTVTVNPIPPQPTIGASGPLTFCDGGSVSLTASVTGITGGTYTWSTGSTTNPLSVTTSGSYSVTYVSSANCTAPTSATTTVTVNPIPPQPTVAASGPLTFCDGGSVDLTADVTGFTGGTFTWSTGSHVNPLTITTSGSYSVIYKSAENCTAPTSAVTSVTVNPIPPQPTVAASGPLTFCDGGSVNLTASVIGFTGGTFTWSTGSTTNPLSVTTSGSYSVTFISSASCTAPTSAATMVTVNPIPPQPTVAASGPLTFCDGGSVDLTADVTGFTGGTYTWSTGSHVNPLTISTSGSFSVIYKSAENCTAPTSAATTVTVNPIPPQPTIGASGPLTFCDGGSVTLTASVSGFTGGTYTWSNGATSESTSITISGSYSVIYTSAVSCTAPTSAATVVTVNPIPPKPTIDASGPLAFCEGGSVTLSALVPGFTGGTLQWSNGEVSTSILVSVSGKFAVTYTSNESCVSPASDTTNVIVYPTPEIPVVSYSGNLGICPSDSVIAKINRVLPNGLFEWYNENQSLLSSLDSLIIKSAGTYSVRFVSGESCVSTQSIPFAVSMLPLNTMAVAGADKVICNSSIVLTGNTPTAGVGTWTVSSLSAPITIASTNGMSATVDNLAYRSIYEFVYTVDGACGLPSSDTVKVSVGLDNFGLSGLQVPADTLCVGVARTVSVNALGGSGNYLYTWVNSQNQTKISTTINTYQITPQFVSSDWYVYVEDKNNTGCLTDTLPIHISALEKQNLFIPNLLTPNGDGKNDVFQILDTDVQGRFMIPTGSYLEIYNRWGDRIYMANDYQSNWGAPNTSDGMYFYYIKTGCGDVEYKGWVQIIGDSNN